MALIPCYECEKEISDKAAACPRCGAPKEEQLPEHVGRNLDLSGLTTAEGLKLPEHVGENLDLSGLTTVGKSL